MSAVVKHILSGSSVIMAVLLGSVTTAVAHENAPAVFALKQVSRGRFLALWTPPFPQVPDLVVQLPAPCTINGAQAFAQNDAPRVPTPMDCAGQELAGEIAFMSGPVVMGPIAVNVDWQDGTQSMYLSRGTPPTVALGGTAGANGTWQVLRDYVGLGLEHILLGIDHLLFVFGLLLLVNGWRNLLATISAFTLAHSITLAAATLGVVSVPTSPVEICIALSILLLAFEIAHKRETITRTRPWVVAFGFGLLHGLGFASALSDVGLPRHAVASALFAFNVGVELGQLGVVGVASLVFVAVGRRTQLRRRVESMAIGALTACSVFWLLQRVEAWLGAFGLVSL
jgi:hydrogenase/urease accessory protein HupE